MSFSYNYGRFCLLSYVKSDLFLFIYLFIIYFQGGAMETQWPRQKAWLLSQRGHLWCWTAPTRLLTQFPTFAGMFNISTKPLSYFWGAPQTTRRQSTKGSTPLSIRATAPSTCRSPQCSCGTLPCTTVLWVTQWGRLQGKLHTNQGGRRMRGVDLWGRAVCLL